MTDKRVSEHLQRSIIIYSALGILVIGVIVAFVSIIPLFNHLKKNAEQNLSFAVKNRTLAIEEYITRAKDIVLQITSRTKAREKLEEYNKGKVSLEEFIYFSKNVLTDALNKSEEVDSIARLDQKGNLVVQVGISIPKESWPLLGQDSKEAIIHGPVPVEGESYLVVGAPILNDQSMRVGTDVILFRLGRLQQIVQDYTGLGKTGETILGSVHDHRVEPFFPLRGNNEVPPEGFPLDSPRGAALEKALNQEVGILKSSDPPEVIAYGPLQGADWGLLVKMDKRELYAPITQQAATIGGIIGVLILLGSAGTGLLLRPLTKKMVGLEREIQVKVTALESELNERMRVEEELQERRDANTRLAVIAKEQSELQDWINTFDTFVGKFDPNGVGVIFNEAPMKVGGINKDEVVGKYFPNTKWWSHSEIERARIVECFERAKTGLSSRIETTFRSADGTPVPIIFNCQPVLDDDGKVRYITAEGKTIIEESRLRIKLQEAKKALEIRVKERTSELVEAIEKLEKEIAERKRAEEELREYREHLEELVEERTAELAVAKERAEAADRLKSAFLAIMSHELRTPLNSILGFTGILLQGLSGPLNGEQAKQLGMVRNSARHLLDLINDVLDISKIEADQVKIVSKPVDMREAVEKVIQTVTPLAEEKNLVLTAELDSDVGQITSDRRRVEQILINLINNAIKFTNKGAVRVECQMSDGWLVTRVVDTGIGIKPEDMDKLFETFRQIDTGLTRQYEGTGLGLSICKKLVEMLGGKIWAESEGLEKGSTFIFTLPIGQIKP